MFAELRKAGGASLAFEFSLEERLWATAAALDKFDLGAVARKIGSHDLTLGDYCMKIADAHCYMAPYFNATVSS